MSIKVKIVNKSNNPLPKYETLLAAGMDVRAFFSGPKDIVTKEGVVGWPTTDGEPQGVVISPGARVMVPTGHYMQLPDGWECQVRSRSGKSLKNGLMVVQGVGTIDADYRGECMVCLVNVSSEWQLIKFGERIAQWVFKEAPQVVFEEVDSLDETDRGAGGFGHTGEK